MAVPTRLPTHKTSRMGELRRTGWQTTDILILSHGRPRQSIWVCWKIMLQRKARRTTDVATACPDHGCTWPAKTGCWPDRDACAGAGISSYQKALRRNRKNTE